MGLFSAKAYSQKVIQTSDKSSADKIIYVAQYKSEADLIIYFSKYKSEAGMK